MSTMTEQSTQTNYVNSDAGVADIVYMYPGVKSTFGCGLSTTGLVLKA